MTTDLVTWLRAQVDEDEQSIRIWGNACWHVDACDETGDYLKRFDEDRMLAEVDAKRRIISRFEYRLSMQGDDATDPRDWDDLTRHYYETVRDLASPYADREGFREEWRP